MLTNLEIQSCHTSTLIAISLTILHSIVLDNILLKACYVCMDVYVVYMCVCMCVCMYDRPHSPPSFLTKDNNNNNNSLYSHA